MPVTSTATSRSADEDTEYVNAASSESANAPETSTFAVSSGANVRFGNVAAGTGDPFCTGVRSATILNWSVARGAAPTGTAS